MTSNRFWNFMSSSALLPGKKDFYSHLNIEDITDAY